MDQKEGIFCLNRDHDHLAGTAEIFWHSLQLGTYLFEVMLHSSL